MASRRHAFALVMALGATFAALSFAPSAFAAISHPFVSRFDGGGTPAGSFSPQTGGLAVDASGGSSAGDVYVADSSHSVVDKFASAPGPGFLCQITGAAGSLAAPLSECDSEDASRPGTPAGSFGFLSAVAVDPGTGDVYVADQGNGVVDRFDSAGAFVSQITGFEGARFLAVDKVTGDVYIGEAAGGIINKFDPTTSVLSTFAVTATEHIEGVAVDNSSGTSAGDVYVSDGGSGVVDKFDPTGALVGEIAGPGGGFGSLHGVAVSPTTGNLYAADQASGVVDEFDSTGAFVSQISGKGTLAGTMAPPGVAVGATDLVYVDDPSQSVIDVFGPGVVVPDVTTTGSFNVAPTSATIQGTVNPVGVQLSDCHFEYVDDTDYEPAASNPYGAGQSAPCVPAAASIPADSSEHAVSAQITELQAGVTYHFRLVAANENGSNAAGDQTFSTPPRPSIDSATAESLTASSVDLVAKINPNGFATTYRFEWGTSTAYGNTIPVPDGPVGSGEGDVTVTQHVEPLHEDGTYHWRVVATSTNGTTTGADHTFVFATVGATLPDGRAYEMVTPPQKNGALISDLFIFGRPPDISGDGSRMIAGSIQCFAGAESCQSVRGISIGSPYAFTRTAAGWQTTPLAPSAAQFGTVSTWNYSADTGAALFSTPGPSGDEVFYTRRADGSLVAIGPVAEPGSQEVRIKQNFASTDLSHLIWETDLRDKWAFDATTVGANNLTAYEYVSLGESQPSLIGVSGGFGSTDLISTCGTNLGGGPRPMSADGAVVFFLSAKCEGGSGANAKRPVAADELFARLGNGERGARTVALSQPSGLSPVAPDLGCTTAACVEDITDSHRFRDAQFLGASVDGSKAFFASTQQLTNTATQDSQLSDTAKNGTCSTTTGPNGCNLYEYDFANPAGHELVDVSAGDTSGGGPRVSGVLAISPGGSRVYFVARGALTEAPNGQGQRAHSGVNNLYMFERDPGHPAGRTVFIATLSRSDSPQWDGSGTGNPNVTPDGRFLLFRSSARLTGDDASVSGALQVFRYDAASGELTRISVGNNGFNDNGNRPSAGPCTKGCAEDARIAPAEFVQPLGNARRDPSMSDDGAFVFFQSPVGLTPQALDDVQIGSDEEGAPVYAQNVYEWHDGHVYLISDGRDVSLDKGQSSVCNPVQSSVCLFGTDRSGANVFFSTADPLVSQDGDTELDYYDARICTSGDPCIQPPPQRTECRGAACQGPGGGLPGQVTAASVSFSGPGNRASGAAPTAKVKVVGHTVRGTSFLLRVSVPGPGGVAISGRGVRSLRRSVTHAGTYPFAMSLTSKARAVLRHRHGKRMKVRLRASYQPVGGAPSTASVVISLKGQGR